MYVLTVFEHFGIDRLQVVFARRQGTMNDITMDDSFGAMKDDVDVDAPAPNATKESTAVDETKS